MYAINLADWHAHNDFALRTLLRDVVGTDPQTVCCEAEVDGDGVVLACDDERGKAIVHVLRKKYHQNLLRSYYSKTGGSWKRV